MALLKVEGVSKKVEGSDVLLDITFNNEELQNLAISGETGSGKSSILKVIAGLSQPDKGEVIFDGERVEGPAEKLVAGHPDIAYLSQQFELQKFLRVEQILSYASDLDENAAERLYSICRIDHLMHRRTDQLSGGERQRIALARLISTMPRLLLLDEPFSNLDMPSKAIMKDVIDDLKAELNITCILVSHDPQDTLSWADHIIVMQQGKIIQQGQPQEIYNRPIDEYVAGLFGRYNILEGSVAESLFKVKVEGKYFIFRPENLKITKKQNDSTVPGKVVDVKFFGGHQEIEVSLGHHTVFLKAAQRPMIGEVVYLLFDN
ncbi:MAG: ABC transporter ATP-binding protein [Candidatus Cyclobacteriaceae bacterium M2_1C_046]